MNSWKQRKHKARIHAQQSKKHRGRSSGTTRKDSTQQPIMESGYNKIYSFLSNILNPKPKQSDIS